MHPLLCAAKSTSKQNLTHGPSATAPLPPSPCSPTAPTSFRPCSPRRLCSGRPCRPPQAASWQRRRDPPGTCTHPSSVSARSVTPGKWVRTAHSTLPTWVPCADSSLCRHCSTLQAVVMRAPVWLHQVWLVPPPLTASTGMWWTPRPCLPSSSTWTGPEWCLRCEWRRGPGAS